MRARWGKVKLYYLLAFIHLKWERVTAVVNVQRGTAIKKNKI